jgi:endonuclease-3
MPKAKVASKAKKAGTPAKKTVRAKKASPAKKTVRAKKAASRAPAGAAAPAILPGAHERAAEVHARLRRAQPSPRVELDFQNAWHLLVATILAAQSTDRTINEITPELFRRWPTPAALGAASQDEVEQVVLRSGFFRNKARAIREASQAIAAEHGGEVPRTMEALVKLPGVARKTANVVLGSAYGITAGFIVDTHVTRLAARLQLTPETDPVKIEVALCELFPKRSWIDDAHRLILHGRHVCTARAPKCSRCPLNEVCPSAAAEPAGAWTERAKWEQTLTESRGRIDTLA